MNLEQKKAAEEKILKVLEPLNEGERAVLYKQLNASGFKLSDCDKKIRVSPPGTPLTSSIATPAAASDLPPWAYGFIV